jgi:alkaline phosphatase
MKLFHRLRLVLLIVSLLAVSALSVSGQDAPVVRILPVNTAEFLPGALFDIRIEVYGEEMPEDFAVSINGEALENAELTSWTAEQSLIGIATQAATWRGYSLPEAGEYVVEVVAGGETTSVIWNVREVGEQVVRNVILFVADGGSVATNSATRLISRGMTEGSFNDRLVFESWDELGLVTTSGLDSIITDSANSASAYNTGHKSAVNATGVYPDTSIDAFDDPIVETLASIFKRVRGGSVGIVTTSEYVDATPAAVWAHSRQRNSTTRSDYALQILGQGSINGLPNIQPEVLFGGGAAYLLPQSVDGSARRDENNVLEIYEEAGYVVVETSAQLAEALESNPTHIMGYFHPGNLDTWLDRNVFTDNLGVYTDQPTLPELTVAALEVLSQNENGFYLMVEGASVDKQLHPMDFDRAIGEMIELDRTIAATVEWLEANGQLENTLLVLVPDHGHSFDVFGTVDVQAFNAAEDIVGKQNAIQIYQQAGFPDYVDEDGDFFPDRWDVNFPLAWGKVDNPPFTEDYQVSPVPRVPSIVVDGINQDNPEDDPNGIPLGGNLPNGSNTSVHTLQDVPIWSNGPGSDALGGLIDNTDVFFAIANALGLDPRGE